jgi:hypothetical protein
MQEVMHHRYYRYNKEEKTKLNYDFYFQEVRVLRFVSNSFKVNTLNRGFTLIDPEKIF